MDKQYQFRVTSPKNLNLQIGRIDRATETIYGVTAMQSGIEAIGHGVMADMKTLEIMRDLGNQKGRVRGRFGHPAMSENATGKQVQLAYSFRITGDKLVHDSSLLSSARKSPVFSQDPVEFILDMAENNPTEFGESVVISADTVWPLTDGREMPVDVMWDGSYYYPTDDGFEDVTFVNHVPANAVTELPVLRPREFHYVDFVNEGALTHSGMFDIGSFFEGYSSEYALQLFQLVDSWRARYGIPLEDVPLKVKQLTDKYVSQRVQGDIQMSKRTNPKRRQFEDGDADGDAVSITAGGIVGSAGEFDGENGSENPDGEFDMNDEEIVAAPATGEDSGADAVDTEGDEEADDPETELQQMAAMANSLDDSQAAHDAQPVTRAEFEKLRQSMTLALRERDEAYTRLVDSHNALVADHTELQKHARQMRALLRKNLEATSALSRNVQRIDGEPVVTQSVPKTPGALTDLEPMYVHPEPSGFSMGVKKPRHYTESSSNGKPKKKISPEQKIMQRNIRMQRAAMNNERNGGTA